MAIEQLIQEIMNLTDDQEEIQFYFVPTYVSRIAGPWGPEEIQKAHWNVGVCNPSSHVLIGEINAKYETEAATLDEALSAMIEMLRARK
jgi:hypothetical protein